MTKNIRKIIALLLVALAVFSLSACGKKEAPAPTATAEPAAETAEKPEEKPEVTAVPVTTEEPVKEETPEASAEPAGETADKQEEKTETVTVSVEEEKELTEYELLDVPLFCRTDFYEYVSEKEGVFDLLSMAKDLGYISGGEDNFLFTDAAHKIQVGLDERVTEDGYKICKIIRYGGEENSIQCTFKREDRFDGSTLYSVNTPDNYTVSMDQILLLTYIMENLSSSNPDPFADLYSEYYSSGIYQFPV